MRRALLVTALCLVGACTDRDTGVVEVAWAFVDRNGDPIFPGGVFSMDVPRDSCDLPGVTGSGAVDYDLHVELQLCDPACEPGCDDPACHVIPALRFPCEVSRGSDRAVPADDAPYRFTLRAVVESPAGECADLEPQCVAVPGPRDRKVTAGLVTDLQVYQIIVDVADHREPLDLEACGCA